jgi:hypothetical protein
MSEIERATEYLPVEVTRGEALGDPSASPFRLVVDPAVRVRLRKALLELIDSHDQDIARYVAEGSLTLDSYKEYTEIFARSLRDTLGTKEGVCYLLEQCGFRVAPEDVNLTPETRWRVQR